MNKKTVNIFAIVLLSLDFANLKYDKQNIIWQTVDNRNIDNEGCDVPATHQFER